jgi:hypothetical protein
MGETDPVRITLPYVGTIRGHDADNRRELGVARAVRLTGKQGLGWFRTDESLFGRESLFQ